MAKTTSTPKTAKKRAASRKTVRKTAPKAARKATSKPKKMASAKNATTANGTNNDHADANGSEQHAFQDFEALSKYISQVSEKGREVIFEYFTNNEDLNKTATGDLSSDPLNISDAFQEVTKSIAANPATFMASMFSLWGNYATLMASMSQRVAGESVEPMIKPKAGDKRFTHPAWDDNPMLDFVKQSYLLGAQWLENTVDDLDDIEPREKAKAAFYTKQIIDALAPSNFALLNPDVIETTIESKGENLLKGLQNLLDDMERGHGKLAIRQADLEHFKLGENIATTPGKVVYQNDIFQLIQYQPTTEEVAKTPMLIVPPWINKYYILDLQPANSFIRWLVEQGRTVFVISWVNPDPSLRDKTFEDYIRQGLFEAIDAIEKATDETKVDTIGYCIGGTMLAMALAYMAKTGDDRINSATFFTAQADFEESGDLQLFVDDAQLDAIEKQMDAAGGVLEGRAMATTFNMLRSNDLIWSFAIDNYLMGKEPAKFDLLFWNSDATRMPKHVHMFYLREFYQHNRLAKGELMMDGHGLNIGDVAIPIYMQAGETDHIAPHNSVYRTARLFASNGNDNVTYMLAGSGHIAGVINHPDKKKYHHSINTALPDTVEAWKKGAKQFPGSWWPQWLEWLNGVSDGTALAREPGGGKLAILEDAPGSYVKVKA